MGQDPFGSKVARLYLEAAGLLPELEKLGFGIVAYACTTCNGMSGALDPVIQQEIIDRDLYTTAVLSGNRNFDGRIHPYAKQAFLASPPLVVAYAIAGTMRFDIERDTLGTDVAGTRVTLKDLWPSDEEIDAIAVRCLVRTPSSFTRSTTRCSRHAANAGKRSARSTIGVLNPLISAVHPIGTPKAMALWPPAHAPFAACGSWRCCPTTSPPIICRRPTAIPGATWRLAST